MLDLILVRHGETDSNTRGTYCGWTDIELNANGLEQAYKASDKFGSIKPDIVYSSPLKRAYETAGIICKKSGCQVLCDKSLMEQSFGEWEDMTYIEISKKYPNDYMSWQNDWKNYCIRDGESSFQFYKRVTSFVDNIIDRHDSGVIVMVTHLGCIRYIVSYLLGLSMDGFWRFKVDNGSISKVKITDEKYAYLEALNII
jgi:alpha-ribazole phosphatase